eukprot:4865151-Pleurochrysis_carterae.AAC.1
MTEILRITSLRPRAATRQPEGDCEECSDEGMGEDGAAMAEEGEEADGEEDEHSENGAGETMGKKASGRKKLGRPQSSSLQKATKLAQTNPEGDQARADKPRDPRSK